MNAQLKYPAPHTLYAIVADNKPKNYLFEESVQTLITPNSDKVTLHPKKYLLIKTDARGYIEYANTYFLEATGYDEKEILGMHFSILWHPDVPETIYTYFREKLQQKESFRFIHKNLAKNGAYFWTHTETHIKVNKASNQTTGYFFYARALPTYAHKQIASFYEQLHTLEEVRDIQTALHFMKSHFAQKETTYEDYVAKLSQPNTFADKLASLQKLFSKEEESLLTT